MMTDKKTKQNKQTTQSCRRGRSRTSTSSARVWNWPTRRRPSRAAPARPASASSRCVSCPTEYATSAINSSGRSSLVVAFFLFGSCFLVFTLIESAANYNNIYSEKVFFFCLSKFMDKLDAYFSISFDNQSRKSSNVRWVKKNQRRSPIGGRTALSPPIRSRCLCDPRRIPICGSDRRNRGHKKKSGFK